MLVLFGVIINEKMYSSHRANVLVTSCLKTPVDPHTKVPLALYERARATPVITDGEQVGSASHFRFSFSPDLITSFHLCVVTTDEVNMNVFNMIH